MKMDSKQELFRIFLDLGTTQLHIDSRRLGVIVPDSCKDQKHLVLEYGYNLVIPIPDLTIGPECVIATLSFDRQPVRTKVPWTAVYAITTTNGCGRLFEEAVPADLEVTKHHSMSEQEAPVSKPQRHLQLVK
jgi:hypothetical protein